jgi:hypothetical protein
MRVVDTCPACSKSGARIAAASNANVLARFYAFSQLKYGGLLDDWLQDIKLVILGCPACGHYWYRDQPEPAQLDAMYAAGRPLRGSTAAPSREPTPEMVHEMLRLRQLSSAGSARLLDYGSGFGRWTRAAVKAGFAAYAFEPSKVRGAEEDVPFTLVHELDSICGKTFDVVNLEQVLEHVPDPLGVLEGIRAFCHKQTLVRITVPNILRCEERANIWSEWPFNGYQAHIMAPFEHLHGFNPKSLKLLVERAGYSSLHPMALWRQYPISMIRNMLGRIYPSAGQTMVLVQLAN